MGGERGNMLGARARICEAVAAAAGRGAAQGAERVVAGSSWEQRSCGDQRGQAGSALRERGEWSSRCKGRTGGRRGEGSGERGRESARRSHGAAKQGKSMAKSGEGSSWEQRSCGDQRGEAGSAPRKREERTLVPRFEEEPLPTLRTCDTAGYEAQSKGGLWDGQRRVAVRALSHGRDGAVRRRGVTHEARAARTWLC